MDDPLAPPIRAIPGFEVVDKHGRKLVGLTPESSHDRRPKLTFDINEGTRTAFKRKVAREGRTMTEVMGRLCHMYVLGQIELED